MKNGRLYYGSISKNDLTYSTNDNKIGNNQIEDLDHFDGDDIIYPNHYELKQNKYSRLVSASKYALLLISIGSISLFAIFIKSSPLSLMKSNNDNNILSSHNQILTNMAATTNIGSTTTSETDEKFVFTISRANYNQISLNNNILKYNFLSKIDGIIEPYVTNQIHIPSLDTSKYYYKYSITSISSSSSSSTTISSSKFASSPAIKATGIIRALSNPSQPSFPSSNTNATATTAFASNQFTIACNALNHETFSITVEEYDISSSALLRSSTQTAMCMYVRREMRSLTKQDLSDTMDAMYTLWSTSESDGIAKYGDTYHDASYLLKLHHFNAAQQESDHIHEGNGFLTQHLKMTNIFEVAMQAVNPAVSLPYWDFTIEESAGNSIYESFAFTADTFGNMPMPTDIKAGFTYTHDSIEDAAIPNGRWMKSMTEKNDVYEDLKMGYGYMRAPWNLNPSRYITRFTRDYNTLPDCHSHYSLLSTSTNMMDFFYDIAFAPHAKAHSMIGGIYGCDAFNTLLAEGYINDSDSLDSICSFWVFYLKEMYRHNYITPQATCNVTVDDSTNSIQNSTCGFVCTDIGRTSIKGLLSPQISKYVTTTDENADEVWTKWSDFVCDGDGAKVFSGDHLESASPADPSFWVIHPTLERLLHAKLMTSGFSESESWPTDAESSFVCDKSPCYNPDTGMTDYYDICCYGHFEGDQLLDFETGSKTNYVLSTNAELLAATDPRSHTYSMSYIYDGFSWDHCNGTYELDFSGLLQQLSDTTSTTTSSTTTTTSSSSSVKSTTQTKASTVASASAASGSTSGTVTDSATTPQVTLM